MPTNTKQIRRLDDTSPSVQTHLGIVQGVIDRMASNSTQCKAWCITIVSAVLVVVADKGKPDFAWIALFPSLLFFALDAYYLTLEKAFRASYNIFIDKVHKGILEPEDLYSVLPAGKMENHKKNALKSFSVWGFYLGLMALVAIARYVVLP